MSRGGNVLNDLCVSGAFTTNTDPLAVENWKSRRVLFACPPGSSWEVWPIFSQQVNITRSLSSWKLKEQRVVLSLPGLSWEAQLTASQQVNIKRSRDGDSVRWNCCLQQPTPRPVKTWTWLKHTRVVCQDPSTTSSGWPQTRTSIILFSELVTPLAPPPPPHITLLHSHTFHYHTFVKVPNHVNSNHWHTCKMSSTASLLFGHSRGQKLIAVIIFIVLVKRTRQRCQTVQATTLNNSDDFHNHASLNATTYTMLLFTWIMIKENTQTCSPSHELWYLKKKIKKIKELVVIYNHRINSTPPLYKMIKIFYIHIIRVLFIIASFHQFILSKQQTNDQ